MRVSHHVKRSVCLLLSLLLLAQGMTLGAAAVGTDSVPAGTSVLEPAAYPDSEVLVLYEDGQDRGGRLRGRRLPGGGAAAAGPAGGCGAGPAQLHIHKHRSLHHRPAAGGAVGPV